MYFHGLSLSWQGAGPRTPAGSSHLVLCAYATEHVLRSENSLQLFLFFQLVNPESQTRVSESAESTFTQEPSGHSPNFYFIKRNKLSCTLGVHQSLSTSLSAQAYLEIELGYMYNMLWGAQDGIHKRPKEQTLEEEGHVCRQTESKAAR